MSVARTKNSDHTNDIQAPFHDSSNLANAVITTALNYYGTPYKVGSKPFQTTTFDCSSFVQFVFLVNGIRLPRYSIQQSQIGITIPFDKMRPGDLMFFTTRNRINKEGIHRVGHCAIFIGNNKMLHTFSVKYGVQIAEISPYWRSMYIKSQRIDIKSKRDDMKPLQDNMKSQQDNMKSQQDNLKSQQDNLKSQQDNMKSQQDNLKSQRDIHNNTPETTIWFPRGKFITN